MLYIVATPIGNLKDITLRAIETLREVDFVLCEDTRMTKRLLNHLEIEKTTISFHEYSDEKKFEEIFNMLREGKKLALVTDAGTPGISDPGSFLVKRVRETLPEIKIVPIPGASAVTALLSVSGIRADEFTFVGFPPHKKGRKTFFERIAASETPIIFYESTHRLIKALEALNEICPAKNLVIGKELTKMFEEIITGAPATVLAYLAENPDKTRGEFVIIAE